MTRPSPRCRSALTATCRSEHPTTSSTQGACLTPPVTYTIFPFAVDQITGATGKGIFTTVTGTAPNRVFNIEWRACRYNGATTCLANGDTSYEVQLVEGTSTFNVNILSVWVRPPLL